MARPTSERLNYFSLDVDMEQDDKIAYIEAKHGLLAFGLIVRMYMRIYKNGYYTPWTEREQYLFSKSINVDINTTLTIVNECINEGLFDKNLYEQYQILTSRGVQKRFLKACDRRKTITMVSEFLLLTPQNDVKLDNVTFITVNADNNPSLVDAMSAKTPQSKVKESKVNKNKINNIYAHEREPVDNFQKEKDGDDVYSAKAENGGEATPTLTDSIGRDIESSFAMFCDTYPTGRVDVNPDTAFAQWRQALCDGVTASELIYSAKQYALKTAREGMPEKFIKRASNFLAEKRYLQFMPKYLPDCPICHGDGWYPNANNTEMTECACKNRHKALGGEHVG